MTSQLIVHQIPAAWGLPSVGPFSLKLEAYLRITGIPYQAVIDATPFKGPKRKLPWIEHEGRRIGDSGFIIEYLERRFGCDPNAGLSAAERAIALSLRRLIEENLYWVLVGCVRHAREHHAGAYRKPREGRRSETQKSRRLRRTDSRAVLRCRRSRLTYGFQSLG